MIFRALRRIGLTGVVLYAAVMELVSPSVVSAPPTALSPRRVIMKTVALTVIVCAVLLVSGMLLLTFSGVYNIAADVPHLAPVRWLLTTGRTHSVEFHSGGIRVPNLRGKSLLIHGFGLYRKDCQPCHGAPGVASEESGRGIDPKPPSLVSTNDDWTDAQLYWITSHGLKMSGMPAFAPRLSDGDCWAIVAFLRRITRLSPQEYKLLAEAADQHREASTWGVDDLGFARLRTANPELGRQLVRQYGCITCHTIPHVGWGLVGPPLTRFAERQYIAGSLVNVPTIAIKWIINPKVYKPTTAMPKLDVTSQDAVNIAAYLYTLGSPKRIKALEQSTDQP